MDHGAVNLFSPEIGERGLDLLYLFSVLRSLRSLFERVRSVRFCVRACLCVIYAVYHTPVVVKVFFLTLTLTATFFSLGLK